MDITVIIVNYNTAHFIKQCIESILSQRNINFEIIVVDNSSSDNSIATLQIYRDQINLIASDINLGFGKANNLAAKQAQGRYLFFLNPDATLLSNDALHKMIIFMDNHPNIGLAGSKIIDSNNIEESLPNYYYPGQKYLKTNLAYLPGKIAWLLGASIIINNNLYQKLNGFDEDYFLYGEDTDICYRVRKLGFTIEHIDEVTVKHVGGGSEKKTIPYELWQKKQKGLHLFFKKNYSAVDAIKIVKRNLRRAQFRLILLSLYKKLGKLNTTDKNKYFKYQAIRDSSKEFLAHA